MKKCGMRCEVYSRVVGYYRPTTQWNAGKRNEFKDRKAFIIMENGHEEKAVGGPVQKEKGQCSI